MPINNDESIPNDAILLRLLTKDWIVTKEGVRRPTSHAFRESNFESSCFVDSPATRIELKKLYPGFEIAAIPAQVFRESGFAIERRPDEVPEGFEGDRRNHVVVGPPQACARNLHERMARSIVRNVRVAILVLE